MISITLLINSTHSLLQNNTPTTALSLTHTFPIMENSLHTLQSSSSSSSSLGFFTTKPVSSSSSSSSFFLYLGCRIRRRVPLRSVVVTVKASAGASHREFSGLHTPLEPRSCVGKYLTSVIQNHRSLFHVAVEKELKLLSDDRLAALTRMLRSSDSDEAVLHRRIAQLKENQCQGAVEDIMYLLIFYKFSEIGVHLVPKLSSCIYNNRLELPSKDWELESIHCLEVLDMIREHVTSVTGLRAKHSVNESWALTKVRHFLLARIFVASILYGYFLKSVSLRYQFERNLSLPNRDHRRGPRLALPLDDMCPYGFKDAIFAHLSNVQSIGQGLMWQEEKVEDLKCYVSSFHPGSLQSCARLRSKEAVNLIKSYSCALFNSENDEVILTSFSSMKRLVLEAIAFGSFLWETEDYIDNVYKLKDH